MNDSATHEQEVVLPKGELELFLIGRARDRIDRLAFLGSEHGAVSLTRTVKGEHVGAYYGRKLLH
jgi:hypothetical protein